MPYPKKKLRSKHRYATDLYLSVSEIELFCPTCAASMRERGIKAVNLSALPEDIANSFKAILQEQYRDNFKADAFFTACLENNGNRIDDAVSVCAALHQFSLGAWPADDLYVGALMSRQTSDQNALSPRPEPQKAEKKNVKAKLDVSFLNMVSEPVPQQGVGAEFDVVIIESGYNLKKSNYSEDLLRIEADKFEGAKCYTYEYDLPTGALYTHIDNFGLPLQKAGALVKNYIGVFSNCRFGNYTTPDGVNHSGVLGRLTVLAQWARDLLRNAAEADELDQVGLSIDVDIVVAQEEVVGIIGPVENVLHILHVNEVTLVTQPAAGGRFLRMAAGLPPTNNKLGENMKEILTMLLQFWPDLAALHGLTLESTEAELLEKLPSIFQKLCAAQTMYAQYSASNANPNGNVPVSAPANTANTDAMIAAIKKYVDEKLPAGVEEALRAQNSLAASGRLIDQTLLASLLPDAARTRVRRMTEGRVLTLEQINAAIAEEQTYIASLTPAPQFLNGKTQRLDIVPGQDQVDKWQNAMDGMILGEKIGGVPPFQGLHDSYYAITQFHASRSTLGRKLLNEAIMSSAPLGTPQDQWRMKLKNQRETLNVRRATEDALVTTDWAEIFGDSMRKALIKFYTMPKYQDWRKIVSSIVPVQDFRTNRRQRIGGFSDLEVVAQSGTYQELAWPADEEVAYAAQKRGNIVSLTWETFVNDDLGAVKDVPRRLGISAARTLYKFVFDFIRTNPTFDSDGIALFHASHANLGSAALATSGTALDARVYAMKNQTELTSGERLGIVPKFLLVPHDLSRIAWDLTKASVGSFAGRAETIENWFLQYGIDPIEVIYWTDVSDWALVANPTEWPTIEIGFLDGNEEPELFVQDQPQYGSAFSADKMAYKIRHSYGGDVLDFRTFDKSVVA